MTTFIRRLLISIKTFLLCLVMTFFKKNSIKKKLFNLSFFNMPILTIDHERLLKCATYPTDQSGMFTLDEKKNLILLKRYMQPTKSKKWKSPVDYPIKVDKEIVIAHRDRRTYDEKFFAQNYNQFKPSRKHGFNFTLEYNYMLQAIEMDKNRPGLTKYLAKSAFLRNYSNAKKKAMLKWRDDIIKKNNWTEQEFNEAMFKNRLKIDLETKLQSEEIINNFIKKHKIPKNKKSSIDLYYALLSEKKRLKRKKNWLHCLEVNARRDYKKTDLQLRLHEEVPWATFPDKELPLYIKTRKGFLSQPRILGVVKPEYDDIKLSKRLMRKFKRSSYNNWQIDKVFPDRTTSKPYDYYTSESSPWWRYKYDLDEAGDPSFVIRTEDFYTWFEISNIFSHFIDQYIPAIPIIFILLCIHWIFVEAILYKFKCQQHYRINTFFLGTWFLILSYWFFNITEAPFGLYKYGLLAASEWPLYFIIIKWIFFLFAYLFILIIFLALAPKSPFLRSKLNMQVQHYIFFFIPCIIGLLFCIILIPRRLPFFNIIQGILLMDSNRFQYYNGYVYIFFILLFIAFTAVLLFYIIVSLKYFILYYKTKNNKYLKNIVSYLFSGVEDESDLVDYQGKLTSSRLPDELVPMTEDWDSENFKVPDGYVYIFRDIYHFIHIWIGSSSKNIFLVWYFTILLYGWCISYLYAYIELPTLLLFVLFIFLIMAFFYFRLLFTFFYDNFKEKREILKVRDVLVPLSLGLFLFFSFIVIISDILHFLGII